MVEPPAPAKNCMYSDKVKKDTVYIKMNDAFTIFYDRKLETKPELISNTEFSVFAEEFLDDSTTKVRVSTLQLVGSNDQLKMKATSNDIYRFSFIPGEVVR